MKATCSKCKIEKDLNGYKKDKSKKLGRSSQCKECQNPYMKKYRNDPKNKVIANIYGKKYYDENSTPELRKKYYDKSWKKEEYREKHYIIMKKWNKENPDYMKEWHVKNKEKFNKGKREKWANDPIYRLKANIRTRIYIALKNKSNASFKLLGCSIEEYIVFLENMFKGNMSWDNYGGYWEIDHIHPLSKGGSFHYTNTQPLTINENRKKSNRI
jgi:5-methylcytosine-specific restriction endonuclease McrA